MPPETSLPAQGGLNAPERGTVHLWLVGVGGTVPTETAEKVLTPEEVERANRFRVPDARAAFITGRTTLRRLLSSYLDLPACDISIELGAEGKPSLGGGLENHLSFNLSHSGRWVLLGFAWGAPLGVDVEIMRPFRDLLEVARRVFAPDEVATLAALPPHERDSAFFRGWTRKEALLKARGTGIWDRPSRLAAGLAESRGGSSPDIISDPEAPRVWSVLGIHAPVGYAAALAVEAETAQVSVLRCIPGL